MSESADEPTVTWDSLEETIIDDKNKCAKKRSRNPEGWKRVRQKKARIAGKEYLNVRGNYVPARKIGPDCKCKLMCYKQVDETMRKMIFEGFYDLKSYDEQNAYLFGLIRKHDIKRKTNPYSARRTCTYKYYLRFRGREINVCKIAFARIHSISAKKIRGLCEKLDQNILFPKDNRGKHSNRPQKIQPETQELIRRHIYTILRSIDVQEYFKEDKHNPTSTELNITKLYKHFLMNYDSEALIPGTSTLNNSYMPRVKMWLYRHVFHSEFKTKEYQMLKKKLELGYQQNTDIDDYGKILLPKRAKRKCNRPKKKTSDVIVHERTEDASDVGVQTYVQRPVRVENTAAVIHVPMDVSFTTFGDTRQTQILNNRCSMDQVIVETHRNPTTMLQLNRHQGLNQTLNLQKLNYTIQESPASQSPAENYQIFQADSFHQNVLTAHGEHPIYHLDKGSGELIPLRPIRISSELNMQLPSGF